MMHLLEPKSATPDGRRTMLGISSVDHTSTLAQDAESTEM
jgi:hypothetical protein